jgi:hypothetical protein
MKKLTEKEIIRLMKEEWNRKIETFLVEKNEKSEKEEKPDTDLSVEVPLLGKKEIVISPGLKVKSKNKEDSLSQGLLYTVHSVDDSNKKITLSHEKQDGTVKRTITWDEFNNEFERQ